MSTLYSVIDLFSGCGGLSLGFELASSKFHIIGAIDKSEYGVEMYRYNFVNVNKQAIVCGDITKITPKLFKELINYENRVSVIIGGPPCPGFSHIGRSKIMHLIKTGKWTDAKEIEHVFVDDPRNKLFYKFVAYVKEFQPKIFLFENVKGIASSKIKIGGEIFSILDIIKHEFEKINYTIKIKMLNAADFGVPQIRERYFIVGVHNSLANNEYQFPSTTHDKIVEEPQFLKLRQQNKKYFLKNKKIKTKYEHISAMQALIDLPRNGCKICDYRFTINKAISTYKKRFKEYEFTITERKMSGMKWYLEYVRAKYSNILRDGNKDSVCCHIARKPNSWAKDIFDKIINNPDEYKIYRDLDEEKKRYGKKGFDDKVRRIPWWRPSYTILAHLKSDGYMFVHPDQEIQRTISVREAARIQSFPDKFNFATNKNIPFTQQFWHIGNAVPPLLAKALGESIIQWLESVDDKTY